MSEETLITLKRKFQIEEGILILLLVLSLVGVGITDFAPNDGYWYWMAMIFIFALAAIFIGWLRTKHDIDHFKKLLSEQAIHWGCAILVVLAAFSLLNAGHLNSQNTSLVILLILAQATVVDGLRVGWRFSVNGVFLGLSAVIAGHVEHFMWFELLLAIVLVAFTLYWQALLEKRELSKEDQ